MKQQALILVCGRPGSGKSTLALGLARELRAVLLDKDCMDEPFSPDDRGTFYQTHIEPKCYQALLNLAKLNLESGRDIILDAPWTHFILNYPEFGTKAEELARTMQANLIVLDIELPSPLIRERLAKRGLKRDAEKINAAGWEAFLKRIRIGEKNPLPHLLLDGTHTLENCLKQALHYIKKVSRTHEE